MELDNIKLQTTWNDAAGSINTNFLKLLQAITALQAEGGGLDESQLEEYLTENGYTTKAWVLAKQYITQAALEGFATEDWVNKQKFLKGVEGSAFISVSQDNIISLDVDPQGGLGNTEQGLGIVEIPRKEIVTDALGYIPNKSYVHTQHEASDTWFIDHQMGRYPSVTVVDSAGTMVFGDVNYDNENQVTITFTAAFSGKAYLN